MIRRRRTSRGGLPDAPARARAWTASIAGVAWVACVVAAADCDRPKPAAAERKPLTVVVSGDTDGWITPCGCTSNQSGGLLRRATYLGRLRERGAVLYLDAGGAVQGDSDYDRLKFEAVLAGEKRMGVAAHNLGRAEASLGVAALRAMCDGGYPLVSANLHDAKGEPVAPPVRVVRLAGRRVAVVGVLSPVFAAPGVRIDDPHQAVLDAIAAIRGTYDSLLVLAYLPPEELEALAAALPEADAVVGGPTGQPIAPRRVGPTWLASATRKGKFLVTLQATSDALAGGEVVEMNDRYPDDRGQRENLETFLARLGERDLPPERTPFAQLPPPGSPADYRVAGTASCAACHPTETAAWHDSRHAHAWDTLRAKHFEADPECVRCHSTGYGLPGGFATRAGTPDRVSVGCESCHGPSAAHVADPHRRTAFKAADQCVHCHDPENSPKFDFDTFWPRVRHGKLRETKGDSR